MCVGGNGELHSGEDFMHCGSLKIMCQCSSEGLIGDCTAIKSSFCCWFCCVFFFSSFLKSPSDFNISCEATWEAVLAEQEQLSAKFQCFPGSNCPLKGLSCLL